MPSRLLSALLVSLSAGAAFAQSPEAGEDLYITYCSACHGIEARGDGPLRDLLTIAPPDLTVLAAAAGGEFPRFRVARQVDGRDPVLAHGGPMPFYGDVFDSPAAALDAADGQPILMGQGIADLIVYLESLQR
ncbi:c-type cytochrome [Rhodobacteraceae bacterium CCMM004]|nr:c-type cytochrome [Rhodobacteraceae bacterium CCMM004]